MSDYELLVAVAFAGVGAAAFVAALLRRSPAFEPDDPHDEPYGDGAWHEERRP